MKISIAKHFVFEAAHVLPNRECYGACANLHGHSYKMTVQISGEVDKETGMLMNFKELKEIVNNCVVKPYDHALLNDFFEVPTAENMLPTIYKNISLALPSHIHLDFVKLYETQDSYAIIENS